MNKDITKLEVPWEEAQRICDLPSVDEMIRNLIADSTNDNAVCLVREILKQGIAATPAQDAARLDWMADEECQIERLTLKNGTRYRLYWPTFDIYQADWFDTPRAAIDAGIAAMQAQGAKE